MLPLMGEDRTSPSSALKGRLADVYVPALVDGSLEALSRRLGNRATIDDPMFGRASTLSSIDPLLEKVAARFRGASATYRHVASATGVDRDVSEGMLEMSTNGGRTEIPIAVVAERRRLREIELRVYYATEATDATGAAPRKSRAAFGRSRGEVAVPQIVAHVLDALRKGAVERVLAAFEEGSRWVDPLGRMFSKRDGAMASFLSALGSRITLDLTGAADDGRTCCIEVELIRELMGEPELAALSFERGESGLLRELRLYYEP